MSDILFNAEQKKKLLSQVKIVWILGGPSSGKRIQCTRIAEKYGCTIISPSLLIQKQIKMDTDIGIVMKYCKDIPDFEMIEEDILWYELVKSFKFVLNTKKLANSMVLVHGYPLDVKQAKHFVKVVWHSCSPLGGPKIIGNGIPTLEQNML